MYLLSILEISSLAVSILALAAAPPQSINPAAALSLEARHRNSLSKRAVGPFCYPRLGNPDYQSCLKAWERIPSGIENTVFGPLELGAQVPLPRLYSPPIAQRGFPDADAPCGFVFFHWPRTRQLSRAPWATLKLAARQLMLQCAMGKGEGGYFYGFGTAPAPGALNPMGNPLLQVPSAQAIDGDIAIALVRLPKPGDDHPVTNDHGGWNRFLSSCAWDVARNPFSETSLGSCPEYGGNDELVGSRNRNGDGNGNEGGNGGGNQAASGGKPVTCPRQQGYCKSDGDCKGCGCRVLELGNSILQFGMASVLVGACAS